MTLQQLVVAHSEATSCTGGLSNSVGQGHGAKPLLSRQSLVVCRVTLGHIVVCLAITGVIHCQLSHIWSIPTLVGRSLSVKLHAAQACRTMAFLRRSAADASTSVALPRSCRYPSSAYCTPKGRDSSCIALQLEVGRSCLFSDISAA